MQQESEKNMVRITAASIFLVSLVLFLGACSAALEPMAEPPTGGDRTEDAANSTPQQATVEVDKENEIAVTPTMEEETRPLDENLFTEQEDKVEPDMEIPQDAAAKAHISFARAALANKLGIDGADIEMVAYETVVWRDGSLGCPQPGMMYTQALVDGYVIQLRAQGNTYMYNGANGRDPFLCEK